MSKFFEELVSFIETQPFNVISLAAAKGDELENHDFCRANPCQDVYSVGKAFTAAAIGMLYDEGKLSVDEKIVDIFADELVENMDERWNRVTIDMLLTHRAGLPGGYLDIDCNPISTYGDDFLGYMFRNPLVYEPGTEGRYSDGAFYLLSLVVTKKTGLKLDDFLWEKMFYKLGFQELAWSHCPKGYPMGATGLYIRAVDMVKLGMIYLNKGVYGGERYLSEEWVNMTNERCYGFDHDAECEVYYKGGMHGQKLYYLPSQGRAVALVSFGANTEIVMDWIKAYKD